MYRDYIFSTKPLAVALSVGIDIGGTSTKLALINENGVILNRMVMPIQDIPDQDTYFNQLFNQIITLNQSANGQGPLKGIGIGAPSCNGEAGIIENAANLPFEKRVEIVKIIQTKMGLPTLLINDSNAAALGEKKYGGAKNFDSFLLLTLGTGLGCGIILNNRIITGKNGWAGELGHVTVFPNDRACGCGRRGCLETYVSATGIKRTAFALLASEREPSLLRQYNYEEMTAMRIYAAAIQEDPLAVKAFKITGNILGQKLAEVSTALEPEAIFLAGGLAEAGQLLFAPTEQSLNENILNALKNKIPVLPSKLGTNDAALLGAASLVWENLKAKMS